MPPLGQQLQPLLLHQCILADHGNTDTLFSRFFVSAAAEWCTWKFTPLHACPSRARLKTTQLTICLSSFSCSKRRS